MDNLRNEKIKENLLNELDDITDEKRRLFDQIKNLEKEEYLLKNNLLFFENYLKLIEKNEEDSKLSEINLNDIVSLFPKNEEKKGSYKKGVPYRKKKDLIEENLKAFDESYNYVYDNDQSSETKQTKVKKNKPKEKNTKIDENIENVDTLQNEQNDIKNNNNFLEEDQVTKRNDDENYFVDLIKRNFDN